MVIREFGTEHQRHLLFFQGSCEPWQEFFPAADRICGTVRAGDVDALSGFGAGDDGTASSPAPSVVAFPSVAIRYFQRKVACADGIEAFLHPALATLRNYDETHGTDLFETLRTFLLMCSLRMLDCYRNVPVSFAAFGSIFTAGKWGEAFSGPLLELGLTRGDYLVAALGVALLFAVSVWQEKHGSVREALWKKPALGYPVFVLLALVVLIFGAYGVGYDSSQFIYNQF